MPTKKSPEHHESKSTEPTVTKKQKSGAVKATSKKAPQPKRNKKTGRITKGVAQKTNKNGTAGAPTKFKDEYCEQMIAYFSGTKYERVIIEQETKTTKQGKSERVKYRYVPKDLPQLEAYARSIGVTFQTLYNWAHEKDDKGNLKRPEFFDAYNVCKQLQKEFLIDNGLMGNYPPASFIFVAKNITDMRDTKDIKLKSDDDIGGVSDAELEEALFD